jgi:hypothetical protein
MSSGATAMALRLASARESVAVGVRRVLRPICCRVWARNRRLSLDAVFGGAFAGLEFVHGGFGGVDEGLLGFRLLAERPARVAVHEASSGASPARRDARGDRRGAVPRRML